MIAGFYKGDQRLKLRALNKAVGKSENALFAPLGLKQKRKIKDSAEANSHSKLLDSRFASYMLQMWGKGPV